MPWPTSVVRFYDFQYGHETADKSVIFLLIFELFALFNTIYTVICFLIMNVLGFATVAF